MKIKPVLKHINPFRDTPDTPTRYFIIRKVLAFFLIYVLAAGIGEALIIGGMMAFGYKPLSGIMPGGHVAELLTYYGFAVFLLVTVLYCRLVEKRGLKSLGFNKKVWDYLTGGVVGIILLGAAVAACCATGALRFTGMNTNVEWGYLIALFVGIAIQSLAEEVMSRGFVLTSLSKRVAMPLAIFVSSTVFALPHLLTILEFSFGFAVISVVNLYLVSTVFSLLYLRRSNIYIISGLHCLWNFVLYGVMGLSVSGSDSNASGLLCFEVPTQNILNGGVYGVEASILTMVVLGAAVIILAKLCKKKENV